MRRAASPVLVVATARTVTILKIWLAVCALTMQLRGDQIAEITSFLGPDHFTPFGLPAFCG